jgi:hypothetical protein
MGGLMSQRLGNLFWGVRILRAKRNRTLHVYADEVRIQDGDLLLLGHMKDGAPSSFLLRSFARGTWTDIFAASCLDGCELSEEHDVDDVTGRDDRVAQ